MPETCVTNSTQGAFGRDALLSLNVTPKGPSVCPCHADEQRSARFAELDALIAAGWGSTPLYMIELAMKKHHGQLPADSSLRVRDENEIY